MQITRLKHNSGRGILLVFLSIAMLLAAHLTAGAQDNSVFVSVRVYDGVDPAAQKEITRATDEGFLPIMRESEGFVGYYLLPAGDMLAAVSLFDSAEQAAASNEKARDFVAENLAPLLPNPPLIVEGTIDVMYVADDDGMMDDASSLYATLRIYHIGNMQDIEESNRLVEAHLLPALQESGGLFSYYSLNDGVDTIAGLNVYASEEKALAANDIAAAFVTEHMMDWLPDDPMRVNGQLGVAALAELHMGENLIDEVMDEEQVFVSIRLYDGVDPADQEEILRLTNEGFLPIMRESAGFVGYYLLPAGDRLAAVSLFDTEEQAAASNEKARDFVAESLAPLLPNPPQIVEGLIEVTYVADADEMMIDEDMTSLHAVLAIYDGFDMTRLDETVELVESVFLPALRENGGLVSYYGIGDGVDKAIALRIADSEESLQQGSDIAADFVAEYLADWLPDDPTTISGQLGIAALADTQMGANLIDGMMDEEQVFVSIRVYDGVDPADQEEIARLVDEGFLPTMRESDGFVGYYLLPAGDMLAAVSFFDTPEQASASTAAARDFVTEKLAPLLPNPPQITEGGLDVMYVTDEMMGEGSLYGALRIYDNYDLTDRDVAVELVETGFLPILQGADGLFSYFTMDDGVDRVVALSVYDTVENALAANALAADFVAEYMSQWIPEEPTRVNGRLGVAALAAVHMGENLIDDMMSDDSVFASVRVYDGVDPANQDAIARLTNEGFLPIMRGSDGFVGYFLLAAGDKLAAVSLFDSAQQASASNAAAREFVVENLAPLLPNAPMINEGPLSINYVAALSASDDHGGVGELHASIRFYEGFDLRHFDEANDLAKTHLLPALQELGGLFAQFAFNDGKDTVVGISIFEGEEAALAANDAGKAFTIEYLADWAPNPPTGVAGKLAIAALAEIDMGANLIGEMMGDT